MWGLRNRLDAGEARNACGPRYVKWSHVLGCGIRELTEWIRDLMDRVAAGMPQEELQRIEEAFLTSSRFEHAFWDMGYRLEQWPCNVIALAGFAQKDRKELVTAYTSTDSQSLTYGRCAS